MAVFPLLGWVTWKRRARVAVGCSPWGLRVPKPLQVLCPNNIYWQDLEIPSWYAVFVPQNGDFPWGFLPKISMPRLQRGEEGTLPIKALR